MAYGSVTGVGRINSHLVGGYTASSLPSAASVTVWLEQGAAAVDAALTKAGYSTPVASTAACFALLVRLNDLWAAAVAERSTNIGLNGDAETRSDKLWAEYKAELADLLSGDLTLMGASRLVTAGVVRRRVTSLPLRRYDGYAVNADTVAASEYAEEDTV